MNIIFVIRSLAMKYGTERTISDKINSLAEMGHDVTLLTYEQGTHPYSFKINEKVRCIDLECRYFTIYKYSLFKRLYLGWRMKRLFKKKIHEIVNQLHPDLITTPTYTREYMKAIMSLRTKTRIVVESHSAFLHDMVGTSLVDKVTKYIQLQNIKCCDLLIALTNSDAESWKPYIKKVLEVRNPVTYYPDSIDDLKKIEGRILAVGRLNPQKRFDRLVEAFSYIADKYPKWYIDIFGEGQERDYIQNLIIQLGLRDRINLKGLTSDTYSEYKQSQFFVLSSDYEGYGLVLLEAMACGIPCVSTDCPYGPSDIISNGQDGLLSKMSSKDLADKIEWMITHDSERIKMGLKSREKLKSYKREKVVKEWEKAYMSVLDK